MSDRLRADPSVGDHARFLSSPVALLETLDVAAVVADLEGEIQECTDAAMRLYERDRTQLIGQPIATGAFAGAGPTAALLIRGSVAIGSWRGELTIRGHGSAAVGADVRATLLCDHHERAAGLLLVFAPAPAGHAVDGSVVERGAQLRVAQRVTGNGWWEWDPRVDRLVASDGFASLLGLQPNVALRMSDALAAMPVPDRQRVQSAIDRALADGETSFAVEYRVWGADGVLRCLEAQCEIARDGTGTVTRIYGASVDVTAREAASEQLQRAEGFWRVAVDSLTARVAILDDRGDIVAVNDAWRQFARRDGDRADDVGVNYLALHEAESGDVADGLHDGLYDIIAGETELFEREYTQDGPSGQRWFVMRITRYGGDGPLRIVVSHQDVTDRRRERSRSLLNASLLDEVDVAVHSTAADRTVLSWNKGAERLFGWTAEEAIGRPADDLVLPSDSSIDPQVRTWVSSGEWDGDLLLGRKDGSTFPAYVRSRLVTDVDVHDSAIVVVTIDITGRLAVERELKLARDYLRTVTDHMGEGMYTLDADGLVTYMNQAAQNQLGWSLDDLHGRSMHEVSHSRRPDGTPLPIEDSPILRARRDGEVVRIDDDIFLRRDGTELAVTYTAAPFSTADGASGCVVVFQDNTERKAEAQRLEAELGMLESVKRIRDALAEERFVLYSQPIIELATRQVVQRELLIRIQDPDSPGGIIGPGGFLPAAEEYGFIFDIDRWVIDRSAELAAAGLAVELNVSAASITDPDLLPHIADAIARTGADPGKLVFEITETALIGNEAAGRGFVEQLHEMGCLVALDDFGTGYAGFTYLKHLPIDYLKIDIEFVRDLPGNAASLSVVQAIVKLAQDFDIRTVAEGVENAQTIDLLHDLGVDYAQGFHISRPAPLELPNSMITTGALT